MTAHMNDRQHKLKAANALPPTVVFTLLLCSNRGHNWTAVKQSCHASSLAGVCAGGHSVMHMCIQFVGSLVHERDIAL